MKLGLAIACCLLGFSLLGSAQVQEYWLIFNDKMETPYRIEKPEAYLSEAAIERRKRQGIAIDSSDLPVTPKYVDHLKLNGAKVLYTSKWFNATAIRCQAALVKDLEQLSFVKSIELVGFENDRKANATSGVRALAETKEALFYGFGNQQLTALNGQFLHQRGHRGAGKTIAVLDGGFIGFHNSIFFDSLRNNGQVLPGFDFVDGDNNVNHASTHGLKVLSVMAANQPGQLVGMAPEANYVCIRTEDRNQEMRIEECNWIAGAEYADSIGADIINSSLGYSSFNHTSMDYSAGDLNGRTALISIAADMAFSKGMLVVTSVGNNGSFNSGGLDAPADARYVIAVGASHFNGEVAAFSSYGPTADGRPKPEIIAPGVDIAVAAVYGARVRTASGTSYSSPLVAGLAAALWSAFPDQPNWEIREAIIQSAKAKAGCEHCGAGLPDFGRAYELLKKGH
jgi:subtilisin family serine protease